MHSTARLRAAQITLVLAAPVAAVAQAPSEPPGQRYATLPPLRWRMLNSGERLETRLFEDDGATDAGSVRRLSHLLRDVRRGLEAPIDPRLLRLVYRVAYHFGAAEVVVVSGYRARTRRAHSYHRAGQAVDFRLEGIDVARTASFARHLSRVGVGHYPTSDFVHLDVRDDSYYWWNRSGPRHQGWNRPLARVGAHERDASWTPELDAPWDPPGFVVPDPDPTAEPIREPHRRHAVRARRHGHRRGR